MTAEALQRRLPAIVDLTGALVAIDSPSDAPEGVAEVVGLLGAVLERLGFAVAVQPVEGYGPTLDARLTIGDGATVLVLGHADTVWPVGTAVSWPFRERDGFLEGPGVGDMKACLAMAVHALALLGEARPPGLGAIHLMVVPDEEAGTLATRPRIETAARDAAACLVLEAARHDGAVVTGRGAVGAMRVTATGVARHVTDPGTPASALRPLAALVEPLEALSDLTAGTSVHAGVLRAGTARQVVPGRGELLLDLRGPTTEAVEALAARVRCLVREVAREDGVELGAEGGLTRPAWPRGPGSLALYAAARRAAAALGVPIGEVTESGGSDASFPGALGVPTLDGLGPVCHDSCSPLERVELASIVPRGLVLTAVAAAAAR